VARLWLRVYLDERHFLGPGKIALLEAVRDQGSISGAARALGMAYRHAWELVDAMNQSLAAPAVITSSGGRSGGGAALTETGESLIRRYHSIERRAARAAVEDLDALARLVAGAPPNP